MESIGVFLWVTEGLKFDFIVVFRTVFGRLPALESVHSPDGLAVTVTFDRLFKGGDFFLKI